MLYPVPSFDTSEKTAAARGAAALRDTLALRADVTGTPLDGWTLTLRPGSALRDC